MSDGLTKASSVTGLGANAAWWRGGVIYQIYPRSFMDANNDGIGDIQGITQRLPYVASLGVDAIWLSPFYPSPMDDFGYDVSDYCDVDPMFGTLDAFRELMRVAQDLGIKVMIDLVLSHTSNQHPWFKASRSSKDNAKSDWYVWADAKNDGNPPNNWLSIFGGSAWEWDTTRKQYYMHNFLTSQPDLNFHNPDVQQAVLDVAKFWLELGVHGFRLDTANFYFHDKQLRDNPGRGMPDGSDPAVNAVNPYGWQQHLYDKSQPEMLPFLNRLRGVVDQYPETTMVGEIGDDDGIGRAVEYTHGNDRLHMAYSFELLGENYAAPYLHAIIAKVAERAKDSWICWSISNHDITRMASRWKGKTAASEIAKMGLMLVTAIRGTPCLYQGDELQLPEVSIAFEDLQDPYGIRMWPEYVGRDGCRTPMPWAAEQSNLGFNQGAKTWLPVGAAHKALAVDQQEAEQASVLHFTRKMLATRKDLPALISGDMQVLPVDSQVLAFERVLGADSVLCVFNTSDDAINWKLPADGMECVLASQAGVQIQGAQISLPAKSAAWIRVKK